MKIDLKNIFETKKPHLKKLAMIHYEHSEQARASHTNGPRDVPRCGALNLIQKALHYKGE
jgi:hypothetical protein